MQDNETTNETIIIPSTTNGTTATPKTQKTIKPRGVSLNPNFAAIMAAAEVASATQKSKASVSQLLLTNIKVSSEDIKEWVMKKETTLVDMGSVKKHNNEKNITPLGTSITKITKQLENLKETIASQEPSQELLNKQQELKSALQFQIKEQQYFVGVNRLINETYTLRKKLEGAKQPIEEEISKINELLKKIYTKTASSEEAIEETATDLKQIQQALREVLYKIDPTEKANDEHAAAMKKAHEERFQASKAQKQAHNNSQETSPETPAPTAAPVDKGKAVVKAANPAPVAHISPQPATAVTQQAVEPTDQVHTAQQPTAAPSSSSSAVNPASTAVIQPPVDIVAPQQASPTTNSGSSSPTSTSPILTGSSPSASNTVTPKDDTTSKQGESRKVQPHPALIQEYLKSTYQGLVTRVASGTITEDPIKKLLDMHIFFTTNQVIDPIKDIPPFGRGLPLTRSPIANLDQVYWQELPTLVNRLNAAIRIDDGKTALLTLHPDTIWNYTVKYETATGIATIRFWDRDTLLSSQAQGAFHVDRCQTLTWNHTEGTVVKTEEETFFRGKGTDFALYREILEKKAYGEEVLSTISSVEELCEMGALEHACRLKRTIEIANNIARETAQKAAQNALETIIIEEMKTFALLHGRKAKQSSPEDAEAIIKLVENRVRGNEVVSSYLISTNQTLREMWEKEMNAIFSKQTPSPTPANPSIAGAKQSMRQ